MENDAKLKKTSDLSLDKRIAIQRMISLGEITAVVSHELKNLILSISGYIDMIDPSRRQDYGFLQFLRYYIVCI